MSQPMAVPSSNRSSRAAKRRHFWQTVKPWLLALVFASVLLTLPDESIKDRDNYLGMFEGAPLFLAGWWEGDVRSILANEPLFYGLNALLMLVVSPELALQLLIFVPALIVAHRSFSLAPQQVVLVLAMLLLPQMLQKHVVHLRQGLAIAVFLLGWFATTLPRRWAFLLAAPLLHSSFVFVLGLVGLAALMRRMHLNPLLALPVFGAAGLLVGVSLATLAQAAGARQGEEYEFAAAQGISGLGFLFWAAVLLIYYTQGRRFLTLHLLELGSIVFYLTTYFLSPVTARVFESTMLLVMLAALHMRGASRWVFVVMIFSYCAVQWLMLLTGAASIFTTVSGN